MITLYSDAMVFDIRRKKWRIGFCDLSLKGEKQIVIAESVNEAEYMAIELALAFAKSADEEVEIFTDSRSAVQRMNNPRVRHVPRIENVADLYLKGTK